MKLDLSKFNTKAKRNFSKDKLAHLYSDEEVDAITLKNYYYDEKPTTSHIRWYASFEKLTAAAHSAKPRKLRKWSPEEDAFIRATYMYLTDSTIGLALNIPANIVLARRKVLELTKNLSNNLETLIWCERDNFEEDIRSARLLKARPDVTL